MILKYTVDKENLILKDIIKKHFNISSKLLTKLKQNNYIFVNGLPVNISHKLNVRDVISVSLEYEEDNTNIVSTKMNLNIIYEDKHMLIVDKPADAAIHPSNNHYSTSLSNGVKFYFDTIGLSKKIRPVNRLDKDTSGIVIFAKNEYIQESLIKQMKTRDFKKEYIAVVDGISSHRSGTIDAPIARKPGSIIEREINSNGDCAITHYEVLKTFGNMTLLKLILETGRTHQIRVHLKFIGHPIVGDTLYSSESKLINRQALHAYKVSFIHPVTNKKLEIIAKLPKDIENLHKKS